MASSTPCASGASSSRVGLDITEPVRLAILRRRDQGLGRGHPPGHGRAGGAQIAEITELLDLSSWPEGTRAIVGREEPWWEHRNPTQAPSSTLLDPEGWRHQVLITDLADADISYLEARHRGHALR